MTIRSVACAARCDLQIQVADDDYGPQLRLVQSTPPLWVSYDAGAPSGANGGSSYCGRDDPYHGVPYESGDGSCGARDVLVHDGHLGDGGVRLGDAPPDGDLLGDTRPNGARLGDVRPEGAPG